MTTVKKRWQAVVISYLKREKIATNDDIWSHLCEHFRPPLRPTVRQFHHFLTKSKNTKALGKTGYKSCTYEYQDDS